MANDPTTAGDAPEAEHKGEGDRNSGPPQNADDARAEVLRQIRLALILGGGVAPEGTGRSDGFDPYNNRTTPAHEVWRPRRRD